MTINTKWNYNDVVWVLTGNLVRKMTIMNIFFFTNHANSCEVEYELHNIGGRFKESSLFLTKEELLQSL